MFYYVAKKIYLSYGKFDIYDFSNAIGIPRNILYTKMF
jgi:hypothetical protein